VIADHVVVKTFATFALADSFRSDLIQAMDRGEAFDIASGLPASMLSVRLAMSWLDFCVGYVAARWQGAAAKTRDSITDRLATATIGMSDEDSAGPDDREVRTAFLWAVMPANDGAQPQAELADAVKWLRLHSLPVKALAEPAVTRRVLHRLTLTLTLTLDGKPAAGDTWRRRRRGLNTAVEYAVELGELEENPLKKIKVRRVAAAEEVDPRVVITHAQARELLAAVSYVGSWHRGRGRRLVGFFSVLYYAGLRPAEAVAIGQTDCELPEQGWGNLILARSLPVTTKKWTNTGDRHDQRGLKQRDPDAVRVVPIPPWLVVTLREHLEEFGTAQTAACSAMSGAGSSAPPPTPGSGKRHASLRSPPRRLPRRLQHGLTTCATLR
jgi:integrase